MTIKIILAGPRGKMGSEAINMIANEAEFELVACVDEQPDDQEELVDESNDELGVPVYYDPNMCFSQVEADVFIDLTIPEVGYQHTKLALQYNLKSVIGTSGFTNDELDELSSLASENSVGCIIAPNFAVGAVLMMEFAKQAAKFFPDVEIIEKHHDQKLDAPSGTALKTVDLIKDVREAKQQGHPDEFETLKGVRGGTVDGIHIHSMRLPGLVAHQEVVFGGAGQNLSIKHDSFNRQSFMDGIKLCVKHVMELDELVYGLENVLDLS